MGAGESTPAAAPPQHASVRSAGAQRPTLRVSGQFDSYVPPPKSSGGGERGRAAPPEEEDVPTGLLYEVKGSRYPTTLQVDASVRSLHAGSTFILDAGRTIFLYHGQQSPRRKRAKGEWVAKRMARQDMIEVPLIEVPVGAEQAFSRFWNALGGGRDAVVIPTADEEDEEEWELMHDQYSRLYRLHEVARRVQIDVASGPFLQNMLSSQNSFVLDVYQTIFVWCGHESTPNERSYAMLKAEELIEIGDRPRCCDISWAVDGAETIYFQEQFCDWTTAEWEDEMEREEAKRMSAQSQVAPGRQLTGPPMRYSSDYNGGRVGTPPRKQSMRHSADLAAETGGTRKKWNSLSSMDRPRQSPARERSREPAYSDDDRNRAGEDERRSTNTKSRDYQLVDYNHAEASDEGHKKLTRAELKAKRAKEKEVPRNLGSAEVYDDGRAKPNVNEHEEDEEEEMRKANKKKKRRERRAAADHPHPTTDGDDRDEKRERRAADERQERQRYDEENEERLENLRNELRRLQAEEDEEEEAWASEDRAALARRRDQWAESEAREREWAELDAAMERKRSQQRKAALDDIARLESEEGREKAKLDKLEEELRKLQQEDEDGEAARVDPVSPEQALPAAAAAEPTDQPVGQSAPAKKSSSSGSVLGNLERSTSFLEHKDRAMASSGRKRPTKNPVREMAAINALTEKAKEKEKESEASSPAASSPAPSRSGAAAAAGMGGFGVLWSVGAQAALFHAAHNKAKAENAQAGSTSPAGAQKKRLIQVKGRRNIFVREVELTPLSMNSGDVFILDIGTKLYQWCGVASNRMERGRGLDVAKKIKDKEHFGRSTIVRVEEGEKKEGYDVALVAEFWKAMGESGVQQVASEEEGGDDKTAEDAYRSLVQLFQAQWGQEGEQSGKVELSLAATPPIDKALLSTEGCFILDCGSEVFVWTGKKSPVKLRNATIKKAQEMSADRTFWVAPMRREIEEGEGVLFKEKFFNWSSTLPIQMQQVASGKNVAATKEQEKIDVLQLHRQPVLTEEIMVDDGHSKFPLSVYRVEEHRKVAVDASDFGHFFDGESYIVVYKYIFRNKDAWLLYFWQGRNSSIQEKGSSALLTVDLDDKIEGMSKEVRVVQNKEPKHFLSIFDGRMVVHKGKERAFNAAKVGLYQVGKLGVQPARAVQADARVTSLNSNNVFLLVTPPESASNFLWCGACATEEEKAIAREVMEKMGAWRQSGGGASKPVQEVQEGDEPGAFWKFLEAEGNRERKYPLRQLSSRREARLFHCSLGTGTFTVHEVPHYCQDDLVRDNAFLLDAWEVVYVWLGLAVHPTEVKMALEVAVEYADRAPDDRRKPAAVRIVRQPEEPLVFTTHFHAWDTNSTRQKEATKVPQSFEGELEDAREKLAHYARTYTYEELSTKNYPHGLDTANLENYLSDSAFEEVFKMSRTAFEQLPGWKKTTLKRTLNLY